MHGSSGGVLSVALILSALSELGFLGKDETALYQLLYPKYPQEMTASNLGCWPLPALSVLRTRVAGVVMILTTAINSDQQVALRAFGRLATSTAIFSIQKSLH